MESEIFIHNDFFTVLALASLLCESFVGEQEALLDLLCLPLQILTIIAKVGS